MRIACVGAVVRDASGRIVVVRRGRPPSAGLWSLPGGRVEPGETLSDAAAREVDEETGLTVEVRELIGRVEIPHGADVLEVFDFAATVAGITPPVVAGDDAADVRWVSSAELARLDTTPGLVDILQRWGVWG